MRNLGFAIGRVRGLLGDRAGKWVTQAYAVDFLDQAYQTISLNLKNASGKNLQGVVTVFNVPAGTTSLYPYQNGTAVPGQAPAAQNPPAVLAGLFDPIQIFVKPAGQPVFYYSEAKEIQSLPHVNPDIASTNSLGNFMYWTWIGNQLRITPIDQPLDIEVTGKFNPPPLAANEDLLIAHEDIWIPTTFKSASLMGVERTNPAILQSYADEAVKAEDNIIAEIMRQGQSTPTRWQRIARDSGHNQWYWS